MIQKCFSKDMQINMQQFCLEIPFLSLDTTNVSTSNRFSSGKRRFNLFSKKKFLLVDSTLHRFILYESMVRHWAPRIIFPCHFSGVLVIILRLNLWSLNWSLFLCSPVTSHHSQYFTCWSPSPLLHLTMKSTWRLFGLIDVSVYWGRITCVLIIYY